MQRDVPGASERNDQLALHWAVRRFAKAKRRDRELLSHHRPDRINRRLGAIKILGGLGVIEQEIEQSLQVRVGRRSCVANALSSPA